MNSFALIEFSSIAEGLAYTHQITKNVDIDIHKQEIMCPGKYVLLLRGREHNVKMAIDYLAHFTTVLSKALVLNVQNSVMDGINRTITYKRGWNYGVVETKRYIQSIKLADLIAKNSPVQIERIVDRLGLIGKGLLIFSGTSADLNTAKNIIENSIKADEIVSISLLEAVKENIFGF